MVSWDILFLMNYVKGQPRSEKNVRKHPEFRAMCFYSTVIVHYFVLFALSHLLSTKIVKVSLLQIGKVTKKPLFSTILFTCCLCYFLL